MATNMTTTATMNLPRLFDVVRAVDLPVRAVPGDVIAVTPGHPIAPVAVLRPVHNGPWQVVRVGPPDFSALLPLLLDTDTVRPRRSA
jgi:hypothetical protein